VYLVISEDDAKLAINLCLENELADLNSEFELVVSDEPPYSNDNGMLQIPIRELLLTAIGKEGW
jgi:hypothetical protein